MDLGFIGLGHMGSAIAENLLKAGHRLTVWNRSPGPAQRLAAKGARAVRDPAEALGGKAAFSMLANDAAIRSVGLHGPLLEKASPGLVHANLATISLGFARELNLALDAGRELAVPLLLARLVGEHFGILPSPIQSVTTFSIGVGVRSAHVEEARAVIAYLNASEAIAMKQRFEMEPA